MSCAIWSSLAKASLLSQGRIPPPVPPLFLAGTCALSPRSPRALRACPAALTLWPHGSVVPWPRRAARCGEASTCPRCSRMALPHRCPSAAASAPEQARGGAVGASAAAAERAEALRDGGGMSSAGGSRGSGRNLPEPAHRHTCARFKKAPHTDSAVLVISGHAKTGSGAPRKA